MNRISRSVEIEGGQLIRRDQPVYKRYETGWVEYQPGDATRYLFRINIHPEDRDLIVIETKNEFEVPKEIRKDDLGGVPYESPLDALIEKFPKCNPYTLWALLDVLIIEVVLMGYWN